VRSGVRHLDDDRYLAPEIAFAADLVTSGRLTQAARVELPEAVIPLSRMGQG
jgi:hypothetical protein